jgi:hypothetical protein
MDQSDQLGELRIEADELHTRYLAACKELYLTRNHLRTVLKFVILDDEGRDDVYIYDLEGCALAVRDATSFLAQP